MRHKQKGSRLRRGIRTLASSNAAEAYAAAVEPMSPRLASSSTGMPSGTAAMTRLRAVAPSAPKTSKNAAFGLYAAATGDVASMSLRQNSAAASALGASPSSALCGSRPTHSRLSTALHLASRVSKKEAIVVPVSRTVQGVFQGALHHHVSR